MFAKIAKFYGWTHDQILKLDSDKFQMYYRMITVIEAQDRIVDLKVSSFGMSSDKEFKRKFLDDLKKKAYPEETEKTISPMEMIRRLKQGS